MGHWTWGNNFTPWGKNPWRTVAFNYEPWPFLLWFLFPLSCQNNHSHLTPSCNGQRLWLLLDLGVLVLCRRQGAEQGSCPVLLLHLFHSSTRQSWAAGATAAGKAANRKNCQIHGYLDLLLSILCLARKTSCIWGSALICGCEDGIPKTSFPADVSVSVCAGRDVDPFPPAGNRTLIPNQHWLCRAAGLALPTQHQPVPRRVSKDFLLISNKTDCFPNRIN